MIEHMFMFKMVQKSEIRVKTKTPGLTLPLNETAENTVRGYLNLGG